MTTRRDFIKKTVAGTAALSLGSILPGFGSSRYQDKMCIRDRGKFTKTGSSLLIMGLCGNAILPLIYGHLADMYKMCIRDRGYWESLMKTKKQFH